jgi:hypothetical protein
MADRAGLSQNEALCVTRLGLSPAIVYSAPLRLRAAVALRGVAPITPPESAPAFGQCGCLQFPSFRRETCGFSSQE